MEEREQFIRQVMEYHSIVENPDFEEQLREVMNDYIIFRKDRLPYEETKQITTY